MSAEAEQFSMIVRRSDPKTSNALVCKIENNFVNCRSTSGRAYGFPLGKHISVLDAIIQTQNSEFVDEFGEPSHQDFEEKPVAEGICYARIHRDWLPMPGYRNERISEMRDQNAYVMARTQHNIITSRIFEICRYVHPKGSNLDAYGLEIRELLLSACTEVEAQWRAVLTANGYSSTQRLNTSDYVKLLDHLKLADYEVKIWSFDWLERIQPFSSWTQSNPTRSLPWYDAYNKTKHDRENCLSEATLRHAIHASIACVVMAYAQFGEHGIFNNEYQFTNKPQWPASEQYVAPPIGKNWNIKRIQF